MGGSDSGVQEGGIPTVPATTSAGTRKEDSDSGSSASGCDGAGHAGQSQKTADSGDVQLGGGDPEAVSSACAVATVARVPNDAPTGPSAEVVHEVVKPSCGVLTVDPSASAGVVIRLDGL